MLFAENEYKYVYVHICVCVYIYICMLMEMVDFERNIHIGACVSLYIIYMSLYLRVSMFIYTYMFLCQLDVVVFE